MEAFSRMGAPGAESVTEVDLDEEEEGEGATVVFPLRPGAQDCTYFLKTGRCKFAERCMFNHPPRQSGPQGGAAAGGAR